VLTTANGRPVVIDGGKAGILIELDGSHRSFVAVFLLKHEASIVE
jgi:hypothetical protein